VNDLLSTRTGGGSGTTQVASTLTITSITHG
jgi:hypothetical protein